MPNLLTPAQAKRNLRDRLAIHFIRDCLRAGAGQQTTVGQLPSLVKFSFDLADIFIEEKEKRNE